MPGKGARKYADRPPKSLGSERGVTENLKCKIGGHENLKKLI